MIGYMVIWLQTLMVIVSRVRLFRWSLLCLQTTIYDCLQMFNHYCLSAFKPQRNMSVQNNPIAKSRMTIYVLS